MKLTYRRFDLRFKHRWMIASSLGEAAKNVYPAAFVELKPGSKASEKELIDFCRKEISSFKVPRQVRFVNEWPMSSSKIQKFRLREALVAELGLA